MVLTHLVEELTMDHDCTTAMLEPAVLFSPVSGVYTGMVDGEWSCLAAAMQEEAWADRSEAFAKRRHDEDEDDLDDEDDDDLDEDEDEDEDEEDEFEDDDLGGAYDDDDLGDDEDDIFYDEDDDD